jgi:hypothetical protein
MYGDWVSGAFPGSWCLSLIIYMWLYSSGSGIASAFLAKVIGPSDARKGALPEDMNTSAEIYKPVFISTDINPHACLATQNTSQLNEVRLPYHLSSLS